MAHTASPSRPRRAPTARPGSPDGPAIRIVYQAIRTLVPDGGVVTLTDLTIVTRLDPDEVTAAMNRLVRCGPFSVSRYATDGPPAWHVRRTDR